MKNKKDKFKYRESKGFKFNDVESENKYKNEKCKDSENRLGVCLYGTDIFMTVKRSGSTFMLFLYHLCIARLIVLAKQEYHGTNTVLGLQVKEKENLYVKSDSLSLSL